MKNIQFTLTLHGYEGFNTFREHETGYDENDTPVDHVHFYGVTVGALTMEITIVSELT